MTPNTASEMHSDHSTLGTPSLWSLLAKRMTGLKVRAFLIILLITVASLMEGLGLALSIPLLQQLSGGGADASLGLADDFFSWMQGAFDQNYIEAMLLGLVSVIFFRILLGAIGQIKVANVRHGVARALRSEYIAALLHARWPYVSNQPMAQVLERLNYSADRAGETVDFGFRAISKALIASVHLLIASLISLPITILVLAVLFVLSLAGWHRVRHAENIGRDLLLKQGDIYKETTNLLQTTRSVKLTRRESLSVEAFDYLLAGNMSKILEYVRMDQKTGIAFQLAGVVTAIGFAWLAVVAFQVPFAQVLVLVIISARLFPQAQSLAQDIQRIKHNLPAIRHLVLDITVASQNRENTGPTDFNFEGSPEIILNDIGYHLPDLPEQPILHGINMRLRPKSVTALVGATGSGKSSLADIISGLTTPTSGKLKINGQAVDEPAQCEWRRYVGYVPQDPTLLNATIHDNLLAVRPEANMDEIRKALQLARVHEVVMRLPQGLETNVGDRGAHLSGGERQKIALACELLRQPRFLILDEATSGLDPLSSHYVGETLRSLSEEISILIIAHKMPTVRLADWIYVLDKGCVIEEGSWEDLASRSQSQISKYLEVEA